MTTPTEHELIFDWAQSGPQSAHWPDHVMIWDETLRDGLQSPSVTDPPVEPKLRMVHQMDSLGIETADIGLPGAGDRQREAVERICQEIVDSKLQIRPACAGRTMAVDIAPMAEVSQRIGIPIEAALFIGSSPIRQYAEAWDLPHLLKHTREAVAFGVKQGLSVMFVTEDTIRSSPEQLRVLLTAAVEAGADRLCLCDTVGAAVPNAVFNLVAWVKELLIDLDAENVGIDWHGHRDRGLDVANTLAAVQAGASRVHGAALGIGERVGNTPTELLLVNLKLLGVRNDDLTRLDEFVHEVSRATQVPIPVNTPIVGRDAFRTATGVHAAAVIKAREKGDAWLADRVYSGVPAGWVGRTQEIEIGPMSGGSNVLHFLRHHGIAEDKAIVAAVLEAAKKSPRILSREEILEVVRRCTASA